MIFETSREKKFWEENKKQRKQLLELANEINDKLKEARNVRNEFAVKKIYELLEFLMDRNNFQRCQWCEKIFHEEELFHGFLEIKGKESYFHLCSDCRTTLVDDMEALIDSIEGSH